MSGRGCVSLAETRELKMENEPEKSRGDSPATIGDRESSHRRGVAATRNQMMSTAADREMCRWLGYRGPGSMMAERAGSATARRREILALIVRKSSMNRTGRMVPPGPADLAAWGVPAGPDWSGPSARPGLEPCQPRPWRVSLTEGDGQEHDIPDHVKRDSPPWLRRENVGDITYTDMEAGFTWRRSSTAIIRVIVATAIITRLRSSRKPSRWPPVIARSPLMLFPLRPRQQYTSQPPPEGSLWLHLG